MVAFVFYIPTVYLEYCSTICKTEPVSAQNMCNALFGGAQTGFIYLPLPSTIGSVLLVELVPVNT